VKSDDINRMIKMRRTTRDEKIVNPGVYEVPEFECPRCGHCCRVDWVGLTPTEFNSIKDTSTTIGYAITKTEAMLKEKNAS